MDAKNTCSKLVGSNILSTCCMLCCLYPIQELYQTYNVKFIALMY